MDNEQYRDNKNDQDKNEQQFIRQTIKGKPASKKTILARFVMVCVFAAAAAAIAAFVFVNMLPVAERLAGREESAERVEITDVNEGSGSSSANPAVNSEETSYDDQTAEAGQASEVMAVTETEAAENEDGDGRGTPLELTIEQYVQMQDRMMDIAEEAERSIVVVSAISDSMDYFNNHLENETQTSGVIVASTDEAYYILCLSAIFNNIERIQVTFNDGHIADAIYQKNDPNTGLAVLKINASEIPDETAGEINTAVLGNSFSVAAGDTVIAMGSPNGYAHTVSFGRISSTQNIIYCVDTQYNLLTTDIIGSSKGSGVLVNLSGEVVGIIDPPVAMSGSGVVSGIDISQLKPVIEKLSNNEDVPYIGVTAMDVTDEVSNFTGIPKGILITKVEKESPAFYAGLSAYDVITMVNEDRISTLSDYKNALTSLGIGQEVTVKALRKGAEGYAEIEFKVEIGELK